MQSFPSDGIPRQNLSRRYRGEESESSNPFKFVDASHQVRWNISRVREEHHCRYPKGSMMKPATTKQLEITCVAKRPDLVPIIAKWLWREWWENRGLSAEETQAMFSKDQVEVGAPQTLILLADDVPVGTASLALQDLEERPDLTPWLAGVFIIPEMRGRGYAYRLLEAFDEACYAASVGTAWLYTSSAEGLYLKAGWQIAQTVERQTKRPVTLMRRDFSWR